MFSLRLTSNRLLSRSLSTATRISRTSGFTPKTTTHRNILSPLLPRANFTTSSALSHGHLNKPKPGEELHITFIEKDGTQKTFEVCEGDTVLDIAQGHNLDMEGACGGSCACSTCHVIVDPEYYDILPEPSDDANDMLDLAWGLTETSRLGCQITMSKDIDGIRVALPQMTRNVQSSDFN